MHSSAAAMQPIFALHRGRLASAELPPSSAPVGLGDLRWGEADEPLTPAYWAAQTWMWQLEAPDHYRLGRTLAEELLACMLGGHGIPAEVGLAAYERLRAHVGVGGGLTAEAEVEALLAAPLAVGARLVRYRFARQKARYVAAAFRELPGVDEGMGDLALRDRLTEMRGVGPKTASWAVRNLRASDRVAILDVHILRAGRVLGIFEPAQSVQRHYAALEAAYLRFAEAIGTRASILDSVMWMTMRQLSAVGTARPGPPRRARAGRQHQLAL